MLVEGTFPAWVPLLLGYGCLVAALLLGAVIFFRYRPGWVAFLLEGVGLLSGFFYSNRPVRLAYRGLGEILIGICYSWLPIATGYYLLTGFLSREVVLLSLPIGLSIFNVILINEFPDEEADREVGKKTLVVRLGKKKTADLYLGSSVLAGLCFIKILFLYGPGPYGLLIFAAFPLFLILWSGFHLWRGRHEEDYMLARLCRNTLLINLSITLILTLQQTLLLSSGGRQG